MLKVLKVYSLLQKKIIKWKGEKQMKKNQTFGMKKITRKNNGITLIALVITVIVLLILAGVTIATLTGENGILTRAQDAQIETRGAAVEEEKNLWEANKIANKYATGDVETLEELLERIGPNGSKLLTQEEIDEINETGKTTIGSRTIEFGTDAITIGEIYNDSMIGQKVTYSSNEQSNWIIFGKDESGNVLLTTESPIAGGFNLYGSAEKWLTYEDDLGSGYGETIQEKTVTSRSITMEDDLDNACSGYGETIQEETVTSRSITMEDINYVTGFTEPEFDTYTFGPDPGDYANKKVNYYFPSLEASANRYWQQPSSTNSTPFANDWYYYYQDGDRILYGYSGGDDLDATSMINADRLKYVIGEDRNYEYLVDSRSVGVNSDGAFFYVAGVGRSRVGANLYYLCGSNSEDGIDYGAYGLRGIRPIVVLPSYIEVEETASGQWDIAY